MVGQKEIELTFNKKMIEIAEEKFGIEIKKKPSTKQWSTLETIEIATRLVSINYTSL